MPKLITVKDGIIFQEIFDKEKVKLLWILKEANDQQSKEDWDMSEFLRLRTKEEEGLFNVSHWRASFGLICKISWGILEPTLTYSEVHSFQSKHLAKILDRIAFINIKKIAGGPVFDSNAFYKYCEDGRAIKNIYDQIHKIKPDIIVCGNTFHYLHPVLPGFDIHKDWIYKDKDGIWINGEHPNARINHEKYFNNVKKALKKHWKSYS